MLTPVFLGFPCGSAVTESACNAGGLGLISGLGRSPGEEYLLQYSGLENSIDCIVPWVTKSLDAIILVFLRLSFKPAFPIFFFHPHQEEV